MTTEDLEERVRRIVSRASDGSFVGGIIADLVSHSINYLDRIEALEAERDRLARALAIESGDLSQAPEVPGCEWKVRPARGGIDLLQDGMIVAWVTLRGHAYSSTVMVTPSQRWFKDGHKTALDAMDGVAAVVNCGMAPPPTEDFCEGRR